GALDCRRRARTSFASPAAVGRARLWGDSQGRAGRSRLSAGPRCLCAQPSERTEATRVGATERKGTITESMSESLPTYLLLCLSALLAGAINSVAGGGTLFTFSALLTVVDPVIANATSTVALVPGSLAGAWGYRRELHALSRWTALLIVPSLVGGVVGSLLVTELDERYFSAL